MGGHSDKRPDHGRPLSTSDGNTRDHSNKRLNYEGRLLPLKRSDKCHIRLGKTEEEKTKKQKNSKTKKNGASHFEVMKGTSWFKRKKIERKKKNRRLILTNAAD